MNSTTSNVTRMIDVQTEERHDASYGTDGSLLVYALVYCTGRDELDEC
jgi:hypothetical protein